MEKLPGLNGVVFFLEENRSGGCCMGSGRIHQGATYLTMGQTPLACMASLVLCYLGVMLMIRPLGV